MGRRQAGYSALSPDELAEIERKAMAGELAKPRSHHKKNGEVVTRSRPDVAERHLARLQNTAPPADKVRIMKHGLKLLTAPAVNLHDIEQVQERFFWYFDQCVESEVMPCVPGLELAYGNISLATLAAMRKGQGAYKDDVAVSEFMQRVQKYLEYIQVACMNEGYTHYVPAFFLLKNHFGYRDQQEVHVSVSDPLGELPDAAAVAERINADIVDVDFEDV